MIIYYTRSQKTKVFAEAVAEVCHMPLCALESDINNLKGVRFLAKALGLVFSGKGYPASNIPADMPEEIYVCSPVWGGQIAAPVKYFLEHANLGKTKVNLLLTASTPVEKYKTRALEQLAKFDCIPGKAYIFATSSALPEKDIAVQHFQELLNEE